MPNKMKENKMIYIKSITTSGGISVTQFTNKEDLVRYTIRRIDIDIHYKDTIADILDELYDVHISAGIGSVTHSRISRVDAIKAIKDGAKNNTWLEV